MQKAINLALKKGATYCEINRLESEKTSLEFSNSKLREMSNSTALLYSIRVLKDGGWGNAFSLNYDVDRLVKEAMRNARPSNKTILDDVSIKQKFKTKIKEPLTFDIDEKFKAMSDYSKTHLPKQIKNTSVYYNDVIRKHEFCNSFGSELEFQDSICSGVVVSYASQGDKLESFFNNISRHGGFEIVKDFDKVIQDTSKTAVELLKAKPAKGGSFDVIVNPDLGGVFAHEAVGHACEADIVLSGGSALANRIGEEIGVNDLNIGDDGTFAGWGYCPFDSEGSLGQDTTLIQNGVLKGYLHTRDTASKMGVATTGNGRAQGLESKPIPRMTNTYIGKGDSNFDEMLSEIKNGYYLKGSYGGQVDTSLGEFLFNAKEGFLVQNGEIKQRVKGASILGNMLSTLKSIKLIGDDKIFHGGGACGKAGQYALTGEGSPHMLITDVTVGGQND